jgi:hypothetical protein
MDVLRQVPLAASMAVLRAGLMTVAMAAPDAGAIADSKRQAMAVAHAGKMATLVTDVIAGVAAGQVAGLMESVMPEGGAEETERALEQWRVRSRSHGMALAPGGPAGQRSARGPGVSLSHGRSGTSAHGISNRVERQSYH